MREIAAKKTQTQIFKMFVTPITALNCGFDMQTIARYESIRDG